MNLNDQIKSVAREIAFRKATYPKWVAAGKMKQSQADHEIKAMEAVKETLERLYDQPKLF